MQHNLSATLVGCKLHCTAVYNLVAVQCQRQQRTCMFVVMQPKQLLLQTLHSNFLCSLLSHCIHCPECCNCWFFEPEPDGSKPTVMLGFPSDADRSLQVTIEQQALEEYLLTEPALRTASSRLLAKLLLQSRASQVSSAAHVNTCTSLAILLTPSLLTPGDCTPCLQPVGTQLLWQTTQ